MTFSTLKPYAFSFFLNLLLQLKSIVLSSLLLFPVCLGETSSVLNIYEQPSASVENERVSACSQTVNSMLLIVLKISVKETHCLTRVTACSQTDSYFHATYHAGGVSESDSLLHKSHSLQPKDYCQ